MIPCSTAADRPLSPAHPLLTCLRVTADALAAHCRSLETGVARNAEEAFADPPETGFRLPPYLERQKQELLAAYDVPSFYHLLDKILGTLSAMIALMRSVDEEASIPGQAVRLMGEQLEQPLAMLENLRWLMADIDVLDLPREDCAEQAE